MNLRSVHIGTRLTIGFGLSMACAALLLATALISQQVSSGRQAAASQREAAGLVSEAELRTTLLRTSVAIRDMGLQTELAQVHKHQAAADQQRKNYLRLLDEMDGQAGTSEVHTIVAALRAIDVKTATHYKEAVGLLAAFSTEPAVKIITEHIVPLFAEASDQLARLNAVTRAQAAATIADAQRETDRMRLWVIGAGAFAIVVIGAIAWRLTRSIVDPLRSVMQAADEVARGNLAFEIDAEGRDEPAQLIRGFDRMRQSLATMVGEVRDSADMVAHAAREIAQGNTDLSSRTEQQASSLQQTASTMNELDSTVRQTAGNAAEASENAQTATRVAAAGGEVVAQVVGTMRDIQASSARIGDIIGVIDGIAFQTNILALNAAVEAARAGEQGRGFAVVASEVRALAGRSADAARQIKELISKSVERVDRGTELVDRAGQTMGDIVDAIRKVSQIATEISAATGEQSSGVSEVGRTVSDMDQATQQNAALVEQSAAAADSLRQQAGRLVDIVARFRLRGDAVVA